MDKKSLFQISTKLKDLFESSFDNDEQTEEIKKFLQSELVQKTDSVAAYSRHLKYKIDVAKAEIERMKKILDQNKRKFEKYQEYVLFCMDIMQESSIEGDTSKISIRKPSQVVNVIDEKKIPINFFMQETTTKLDKLSLKEALKNGAEIAGAKLVDGKRTLTVK